MERIVTDTLHFSCQHINLALPLGELSPQVTERALVRSLYTLSVFASLRHLPQRERQEGHAH